MVTILPALRETVKKEIEYEREIWERKIKQFFGLLTYMIQQMYKFLSKSEDVIVIERMVRKC